MLRSALHDVGGLQVLVAAAVVVLGGMFAVRLSQGSPPAATWEDLGAVRFDGAAAASNQLQAGLEASGVMATGRSLDHSLSPGDRVVVAEPGDSLWSIARSLAPNADPRPIVAALAEANGGETLRIGQQIVVPVQLLD
ncbi:MAG: LysM peptidoglycan-binding domain-containing protein [Acidimicrobiales bacterium]